MVVKVRKGVIRSFGLGLLLVAVLQVSTSQSWASLATVFSEARVDDLTKFNVSTTGMTFTPDPIIPTPDTTSQFPDISDVGGYQTSLAQASVTSLSATANAGVYSGSYTAQAQAWQMIYFNVTAPGSMTLSINVADYYTNTLFTPGTTAYPLVHSGNASVSLEIWKLGLGDVKSGTISGGVLSVSEDYLTGDYGYYKIMASADAFAEAVPEPATIFMVGAGLIGLIVVRKKNIFG